jgi:hypothetical protein
MLGAEDLVLQNLRGWGEKYTDYKEDHLREVLGSSQRLGRKAGLGV